MFRVLNENVKKRKKNSHKSRALSNESVIFHVITQRVLRFCCHQRFFLRVCIKTGIHIYAN